VQVRATSNADTSKYADVSVTIYAIRITAAIYTAGGWTSNSTSSKSGQRFEVDANIGWDATNSGESWTATVRHFEEVNGKDYYVAPSQNPAPSRVVEIVAASKADPGKYDSLAVTVYAITVDAMANCGWGMQNSCPTKSGATVPISAAVVHDATNGGVMWQLSGPGSLANQERTTGNYMAPVLPCVPPGTTSSPVIATIKATSVADTSKFDDTLTVSTYPYTCPE
jgi:hypothetical protein